MDRRAASYREFRPLYQPEHSRPATRGLHHLGTGRGLVFGSPAARAGAGAPRNHRKDAGGPAFGLAPRTKATRAGGL